MKRAWGKLNGTGINGRNTRLIEDKPQISHKHSYSGSRHRSRHRRGSRSRSRRSLCSRPQSISKITPNLGLGTKFHPNPIQKAGNPDQRANLSPSLIRVPIHTQEADLRISMGSHEVGHILCPPKKMEREIDIKSNSRSRRVLIPFASACSTLKGSLHVPSAKELQGPLLDHVQGPDQVPEINPELYDFAHYNRTFSYLFMQLVFRVCTLPLLQENFLKKEQRI